ncbi:MAG: valine--tRNA ligase [Pseudomonadota bacterium]
MNNQFDPSGIEQALYAEWEAAGHFAPAGNGDPYCIAIPPPNVTGSLHMGHAFQHTLMDALIRYQRMRGRSALWQMGTDHAGISTQMLVERRLAAQGIEKDNIGRDAFIDKVWEWKAESGGTITQQLRRMGSSLDWSRERFTLDDGFSRAVREVFVRLFEEGLIYRGQRLVNWDPELQTAISDLEVENTDEQGHLWHFRYPLNDGRTTAAGADYLVVATTRPETMLGDTAVAVHPDDDRYRDLIGASVRLPLAGRDIPIIADTYVEREFGTGCVKITPAHDFNDNDVGTRHDLPLINIFDASATINDQAPETYRGLTREDARTRVVADLEALGLVDKIEPHALKVPRGDRSGAVIEPWLTNQWFVDIKPLAEPAIAAVEDGSIEFVPKQYENTYFAWMRDIQDWCISRQQWWGHRIPAWFDADGNVYVARSEAEARQKHGLADEVSLTQEDDVLETWFSSALWTFGTLGWPEQTAELEKYHPTDVLVTGHDIIFFWVARMIMMTLHFTNEVPFRKVYIHGLVRDEHGRKMSKTKGNGLDPLDLIDGIDLESLVAKRTSNLTQPQMAPAIEQATRTQFPEGIAAYGTDALRFTYCALASTGRDVRFDMGRIEGYRNFCNKLWNASRFVFTNIEGFDPNAERRTSDIDRWILSRLSKALTDLELAFSTYRFDMAASALYEFIWHEFCDWYLELTKPLLWDEDTDAALRAGTQATLITVLSALLRAAHPLMPFITEAIWRELGERSADAAGTIMLQSYPLAAEFDVDESATTAVEWLKRIIEAVRNIRGEANIKPSQELGLLLDGGDAQDRRLADSNATLLMRLARVSEITWLDAGAEAPAHALALAGDVRVMVPLAGLIDVGEETARLEKEIERLGKDLKRLQGKLGNENFVAKAPAEVVDKERAKAAEREQALNTLREQLEDLKKLG